MTERNGQTDSPAPNANATSGVGTFALGYKGHDQKGNTLFTVGLGALAAALAYYAYTTKVDDPVHLYCGLIILVGGSLPALLWAQRKDQRFPVFEVMMLTTINTYAIPLLGGHQDLAYYSDDTITRSAAGVILFQIVAISTYGLTTGRPKRSPTWTEEVVSRDVAKYLAYGMVITTTYTVIILTTDWVPRDLAGPIRAVCYGVGVISTFVQARMWGQGTLPHHMKATFITQLVLQIFFSWAALLLIAGISILVLALLGFVSGGKRLPIAALVITLPIIAILHSGKSKMREKYWEGGAQSPTISQIPAFYVEWIGYAFESTDTRDDSTRKHAGAKLLERTSLLHMLCLVVDCTPARQPFLDGETYGYVPGQLVPSFFWPGKPPSHVATYRLSIYYGLQDEGATSKTTIAFGMIPEAYANFGFFGIGLLGAMVGFAIKKFGDWATYSPILSYPGLVLVVLMAWSFQAELTMAAWLSSFYQACVAILGVPFVMRNFLGHR